jgi:hypothetical protein
VRSNDPLPRAGARNGRWTSGLFFVFRIGDALAARNIYAAIYDGIRFAAPDLNVRGLDMHVAVGQFAGLAGRAKRRIGDPAIERSHRENDEPAGQGTQGGVADDFAK